MTIKQRTAVLISGRGSNMAALIEAARDKRFPARIALVIANEMDAAGIAVAHAAGVKSAVVVSRSFPDREKYDRVLDQFLNDAGISLVCLAGFMRILSPWFVERWTGRLINVHPSLLPAYKGLKTHERALAEGARIHGCSTHFVTTELDGGPVIMQAALAVDPLDTPETLAARVLEQEHAIYPRTLALVASGAARLEDGRCVIDGAQTGRGVLVSPTA